MKKDREQRLLDYLERVVAAMKQTGLESGLHYCCTEDFLLQNGRFFEQKPLSSEDPDGELRRCFSNATDLLCSSDALTYVEGMALITERVPVHHAWCIDPEEKVVDATWRCSAFQREVDDALDKATPRNDSPSAEGEGVLPCDMSDPASLGSLDDYRATVQRIHELSKDAVYFGVCFPTGFVMLAALRASRGTGYGGVLDDEKCVDFLLREPFDPTDLCRHFDYKPFHDLLTVFARFSQAASNSQQLGSRVESRMANYNGQLFSCIECHSGVIMTCSFDSKSGRYLYCDVCGSERRPGWH